MITVTQSEEFECSYLSSDIKTSCKFNSHRYTIDVTVAGDIVDNIIIEFSEFNALISMMLPANSFIYNKSDKLESSIAESVKGYGIPTVGYNFEPSAENLVKHFAVTLQQLLDIKHRNVQVLQIDLHENAKSYASWRL